MEEKVKFKSLPYKDYHPQLDHAIKPVDYVIDANLVQESIRTSGIAHDLKIHEIEIQFLKNSVRNLHWLVFTMCALTALLTISELFV